MSLHLSSPSGYRTASLPRQSGDTTLPYSGIHVVGEPDFVFAGDLPYLSERLSTCFSFILEVQ